MSLYHAPAIDNELIEFPKKLKHLALTRSGVIDYSFLLDLTSLESLHLGENTVSNETLGYIAFNCSGIRNISLARK